MIKVLYILLAATVAVGILFSLMGCSKKELLPGEAAFLVQVEPAEATVEMYLPMSSMVPEGVCKELRAHYDAAVKAFQTMMPNLKGMGLRNRDMRLQKIREFVESRC